MALIGIVIYGPWVIAGGSCFADSVVIRAILPSDLLRRRPIDKSLRRSLRNWRTQERDLTLTWSARLAEREIELPSVSCFHLVFAQFRQILGNFK